MLHYASGTPANDDFQVVENQLARQRLFSVHPNHFQPLSRWVLEERVAMGGKPKNTLKELFELALHFLSSRWNIWQNGRIEWQKTVLRMAFSEPVRYSRSQGVRTAIFSFPFKVLEGFSTVESEMAHLRGFEPLASAFGGSTNTFPKHAIEHVFMR